MAISQRDWEKIEKLAAEITWPLGSQGVAAGRGNGSAIKYFQGEATWDSLTQAEQAEVLRLQQGVRS